MTGSALETLLFLVLVTCFTCSKISMLPVSPGRLVEQFCLSRSDHRIVVLPGTAYITSSFTIKDLAWTWLNPKIIEYAFAAQMMHLKWMIYYLAYFEVQWNKTMLTWYACHMFQFLYTNNLPKNPLVVLLTVFEKCLVLIFSFDSRILTLDLNPKAQLSVKEFYQFFMMLIIFWKNPFGAWKPLS